MITTGVINKKLSTPFSIPVNETVNISPTQIIKNTNHSLLSYSSSQERTQNPIKLMTIATIMDTFDFHYPERKQLLFKIVNKSRNKTIINMTLSPPIKKFLDQYRYRDEKYEDKYMTKKTVRVDITRQNIKETEQ